MRVLDAIIIGLLVVGNLLALQLWWWLFGIPLLRKTERVRGHILGAFDSITLSAPTKEATEQHPEMPAARKTAS
jgi:hypothetical protein